MERRNIQDFTVDYISSYNVMLQKLPLMVENMRVFDVDMEGNERYTVSIKQISIRSPKSKDGDRILYPWECRRSKMTYDGEVIIQVGLSVNGTLRCMMPINIGSLPIMVKSKLCNLLNMNSEELKAHNEEDDELGGYFIVGGNQVMMRYLVQMRRNFPILKFRENSDKKADRTGHQIVINCVREDETISAMTLFWKGNTAPDLGLTISCKTFFVPLPYVLMALVDKTAREMINDIPKTQNNVSLLESLFLVFEKFNTSNEHFLTQMASLEYLGNYFRGIMRCSKWVSNVDVGKIFLKEYVAIHLPNNEDKYYLLITMLLKLQNFVSNRCCEESFDTLNFQEILTPGAMFMLVLKKALETSLSNVVRIVPSVMAKGKCTSVEDAIRTTFKNSGKVLSDMNYFMSTGNIRNGIIPGIKQSTGLRIIIDNINFYRYVANFRAFHRGAFFTTMKTSAIRRLLPESWGFVCPVHTPDGTPCGLLNHFTINTMVQSEIPNVEHLANLDFYLRQFTLSTDKFRDVTDKSEYICVMCDGKIIGYVLEEISLKVANFLRKLKVVPSIKPIPKVTEIVLINKTQTASQFPGLYIFTTPGRLHRPVYNVMFGKQIIEQIGTFEQTYLDIACRKRLLADGGDIHSLTTHLELRPESIFSFIAGFTPYQNHNPSARNLYQCQMSKQSMGWSYYTTKYRADNKLYCFMNPQVPLTRATIYDEYNMEKRPLGYNPVVVVASYTGYDMEDAMVINRSSLDRGMGRCCIYKCYCIDLNEQKTKRGVIDELFFGVGSKPVEGLDVDGLPAIGQRLEAGKSALYAHYCPQTDTRKIVLYKEKQTAYVVNVSLNGSWSNATICVKLERNTVIGDKFASRHGQKGVNSLQLPMIDLPYNEDGIVPDQLFNPHSFPSRMTIGKLIEFTAGKLAALSATIIDSTAFQGDVHKGYKKKLTRFHYDGTGNERLNNGNTGRMIDSDLNMGIIYYQRLRHLVDDKYQVRSMGRIDTLTRQPVKGRKLGGGIRLGEMERDGLLSHGAVFCLQDRMIDCSSDKITVNYCPNCRSFVHSYFKPEVRNASWVTHSDRAKCKSSWQCRFCDDDDMRSTELLKAEVPATSRHLFHELASMNIRVCIGATSLDDEVDLE